MMKGWTPHIYNNRSFLFPYERKNSRLYPSGSLIIDRVAFTFEPYNIFYKSKYWILEKLNIISDRGEFAIRMGRHNDTYYSYHMKCENHIEIKHKICMAYKFKERPEPGDEITLEFKNNTNALVFMTITLYGYRNKKVYEYPQYDDKIV